MIVTAKREQFIKDHFLELSFGDRKLDKNKFESLRSAELHFLAEIYNWDDGIEVLNMIIDSERCDAGTAMLIFWKAEPYYYTQYDEDNVTDMDKDVLLLLKKIIKKIENKSFRHSWFTFNPIREGYDVDEGYQNPKWTIPHRLKNGTSGFHPIYLGTTFQRLSGLFKYLLNFRRQLRRKKRRKR